MGVAVTNKTSHQSASKKALWWMLLLFLLPVVAAKLILTMNWYHSGVTNKGIWLEPKLYYHDLKIENPAPHKWQIAYLMPNSCLDVCQQQLHLLQQGYLSLGKDLPRVRPVVMTENPNALDQSQTTQYVVVDLQKDWMKEHGNLAQGRDLAVQDFVLIDPLGQWVMRYPTVQNTEQLPSELKGMLKDLRKMLTLSRVD
ncbi:MAG: hypothetical protein ACK5NC_15745 [Vibrio sp.]